MRPPFLGLDRLLTWSPPLSAESYGTMISTGKVKSHQPFRKIDGQKGFWHRIPSLAEPPESSTTSPR